MNDCPFTVLTTTEFVVWDVEIVLVPLVCVVSWICLLLIAGFYFSA